MGLFGISEDYLEKSLSLDTLLIKDRAATFFFEASTDSMEPLISKNDVLVVDRSTRPTNDDVVVLVFENELILRKYVIVRGRPCYLANSPEYLPIEGEVADSCVVWGVVTSAIRKFR